VTIARPLGLDPSTVSNFFMNARRRSVDKWKDDSLMDDDQQEDNLMDGMSDDECDDDDDMMSSSDEMSQHANNHHYHMQQQQDHQQQQPGTLTLTRYADGTVKAMPIHLGAGSVLVATSATHPAAVVQHLQHPAEALTPTSLDL